MGRGGLGRHPRLERKQRLVLRERRGACDRRAGTQQEGVADDLALLLDTVTVQSDAGAQRIVIAAPRMPYEREEDAALVLPDMRPVFALMQRT